MKKSLWMAGAFAFAASFTSCSKNKGLAPEDTALIKGTDRGTFIGSPDDLAALNGEDDLSPLGDAINGLDGEDGLFPKMTFGPTPTWERVKSLSSPFSSVSTNITSEPKKEPNSKT